MLQHGDEVKGREKERALLRVRTRVENESNLMRVHFCTYDQMAWADTTKFWTIAFR